MSTKNTERRTNLDRVREMDAKGLVALFEPAGCPPGRERTAKCQKASSCDLCWKFWLTAEVIN